jgi:putative pyruvate formate lyase activating enzyme
MQRQVGVLTLDRRGVALRGLLIRHLVMPNRVAGTQAVLQWISENLPRTTYVNIMAQYRVEYRAFEHPEIARGITVEEFLEAMEWARWYGLTNLDPHSVELRNLYLRRRN